MYLPISKLAKGAVVGIGFNFYIWHLYMIYIEQNIEIHVPSHQITAMHKYMYVPIFVYKDTCMCCTGKSKGEEEEDWLVDMCAVLC